MTTQHDGQREREREREREKRVPYKEPRRWQNSHPIAAAYRAVGVRGVDAAKAARAALDHFPTLAGHAARSARCRRVLRGREAGGGDVGGGGVPTARFVLLVCVSGLGVAGGGDGLGVLLVFVDGPVEDVVILEPFPHEEIPEDLAEIGVVRLVVEAQGTGVVQIDGEFAGEAPAQHFGRGGHFLLHDAIVLLLLRRRFEPLPGQGAPAEVEHDVSQRFHVVPTGLFYGRRQRGPGRHGEHDRVPLTHPQMGVDAGVPRRARQVLVLTVGNVEMGLRVPILLGQAKINHVDLVAPLADPHQKVVRLDVPVDEGLGMDVFNPGDELIGQQQDRLQGEFAVAKVEQILQAGT